MPINYPNLLKSCTLEVGILSFVLFEAPGALWYKCLYLLWFGSQVSVGGSHVKGVSTSVGHP